MQGENPYFLQKKYSKKKSEKPLRMSQKMLY